MAGIGFVLKKLLKRDTLWGYSQAFLHAAVVATGPWILTVLCIGLIMLFGRDFADADALLTFRLVIIYNFAFSLVFTGIIVMLISRYISDAIYLKNFHLIPSVLIGSLLFIYGICTPIVAIFYFGYINLPFAIKMVAFANFMLIATLWVVTVFISTLKRFNLITFSFFAGLFVAFILGLFLSHYIGALGLLAGFTVGIALLDAILIARVLADFNFTISEPFDYLRYFKSHWDLALIGLIYNCAIWIDKWIMWFSPQGEKSISKFIFYSNYDSAMFLAYLSVVPAMGLFMLNAETDFFSRYSQYFRDVQQQAPYGKILFNRHLMQSGILKNGRNILIIQMVISVSLALVAPKLFSMFNINYLQIGIFRYGVIGSMFQIFSLFLTIILAYFDNRKALLRINLFFLASNAALTYLTILLGFPYYGLGYLAASVLTFMVSGIVLFFYMNKLDYHLFITQNPSIE